MICAVVCVPIEWVVRSRTLRSRTRSLPELDRDRSLPPLLVYSVDAPVTVAGVLPWLSRTRPPVWISTPAAYGLPSASVPATGEMLTSRLPSAGVDVSARNWPVEPDATYWAALMVVASTIPATTMPAASSPAGIVDAAMFDATIVPAWMVAEASNLNGAQMLPFHWE